jgi:hypothetical protein
MNLDKTSIDHDEDEETPARSRLPLVSQRVSRSAKSSPVKQTPVVQVHGVCGSLDEDRIIILGLGQDPDRSLLPGLGQRLSTGKGTTIRRTLGPSRISLTTTIRPSWTFTRATPTHRGRTTRLPRLERRCPSPGRRDRSGSCPRPRMMIRADRRRQTDSRGSKSPPNRRTLSSG